MKKPTKRCLNCGELRACLIICAFVPSDRDSDRSYIPGYDESDRVPICRPCLAGDFGTLANFIATEAR